MLALTIAALAAGVAGAPVPSSSVVAAFPGIGTVRCFAKARAEEPFEPPEVTCATTGGRSLARVAFDVGLDGPSAVQLRLVPDPGGPGSLILALAYEDGGTGRLVAVALLGEAGRALEVLLRVEATTNLAAVCLGGLGSRRGVGAAVWTWLWGPGEAHADAHRFRVTVYRRNQAGFAEESTVETGGRHRTWTEAAVEVGLTCEDYLWPAGTEGR